MSEPEKPSSEEEQDELPLDPAERAEVEWLLARDENPDAPPPNKALEQEHDELAAMLDSMPVGKPERGWHADVLRLIDEAERNEQRSAPSANEKEAEERNDIPPPKPAVELAFPSSVTSLPLWRRTRVRLAAAATAVAAGAATVALVVSSNAPVITRPLTVENQIFIEHDGSVVRGSDPATAGKIAVNKLVRIKLKTPLDGVGEVRIFRRSDGDGILVSMCKTPGQQCREVFQHEPSLHFTAESTGEYVIVVINGESTLPLDAKFNEFLDAAKNAKTLATREDVEAE